MLIALSPTHPDPMYKQVTDQLRDAIAAGELRPDDLLPSIRELCEVLKVSAITIKRAYQDLEAEGCIVTRAGLGSFVAAVDREAMRQRKLAELGAELRRIVRRGAKFGISAEEIAQLTLQVKE